MYQVVSKGIKSIGNGFKEIVGWNTHKAAFDIIRSPGDLAQRRQEIGEQAEFLKSLSFGELLDHWQIPRDRVGYLRKMLILEIIGLAPVIILCGWSIGHGIVNADLVSFLGGILLGAVVGLSCLQRHRWYSILKNEKYRTFREYLLGKKGE